MSKMMAAKDVPATVVKPKYMWDKKWVRPHESLWSVMRNFRIVNGHCSYREALTLLGIGPLASKKQDCRPEPKYGIYSKYTIKDEWKDIINEKLLPDDYDTYIAPLSRLMKSAPGIITRKLYYCPQCMKFGYHSYLHQLSSITHCPIHRDEILIMDYHETFIWGESDRFYYDQKDRAYMNRITPMVFGFYDLSNFDNIEINKLPTQWKIPKLSYERITNIRIYDAYESIAVSSSSLPFINSDICGGSFFLTDYRRRKPFVTIYDRESADLSTWNILISEGGRYGINITELLENKRHCFYCDNLLQNLMLFIIANRFIGRTALDEIRRSEGYLAMGGKIKRCDSTDADVLFLWDYIGCKYLHDFLSMRSFNDLSVDDVQYVMDKRYCGQNLLPKFYIRKYGLAAALHILEDHLIYCHDMFNKSLAYELKVHKDGVGMKNDLDVFYVPTYLTEERDGNVYIYREM